MVAFRLFLLATLQSPSPMRAPERPVVEMLVIHGDLVVIHSLEPIESVYLSDLSEWCSYFVNYSPDARTATILIRTKQSPLRVVVETTAFRELGLRQRHVRVVKNPGVSRRD
jgi:hypothetical protein